MNNKNPSLLPSGFYDLLPPDARKESAAVAQLIASFESYGYAQVTPPLMEFEASLLSGRGASLSAQTFRVMDPLSQAMMGVRADITMQVARIASTRMNTAPRPLRLCYAGQILQIKPEALQNERQLTQAGIELIGTDSLNADVEVMMIATKALLALGIEGLSLDINLPGLLGTLCPEAMNSSELQAKVRDAVSHRDTASIRKLPLKQASVVAELIEAAGAPEKCLRVMEKLKLEEAASLRTVTERLAATVPGVSVTIDPLEYRGFDYHQGISFSLFAKGLRHELGRGGRYKVEKETATGFTIYVTHLLDLLPAPATGRRILVPHDIAPAEVAKLHAESWVTVGATSAETAQEAQRLGIAYIWKKNAITEL